MGKNYKRLDEMPIIQNITIRPSISIDHLIKQLDEINRQYHNYNKLHLFIDETWQFIQINYTYETGIDVPLTGWINMEQVGTYLQNYQRMFCLDPNRLDLFSKWMKLRPLYQPAGSAQQENARKELLMLSCICDRLIRG